LLMIFGRFYRMVWVQSFKLGLEWMCWGLSLSILEGFAFTISDKDCVPANGSRGNSPECNAIYAGLAFAGAQLILFSISVGLVQYFVSTDYKKRKNERGISNGNSDESGVP